MAVTKTVAMISSLSASRWTTCLIKKARLSWRITVAIQVIRKMSKPNTNGLFPNASRSDCIRPGCSCRMYSSRSLVPKKTSSMGKALMTAKMAPIVSTRDAFSGRNESTMSQGMVKASRLPRIEKNIR